MERLITISMILIVLVLGMSTVDALSIETTSNIQNILECK